MLQKWIRTRRLLVAAGQAHEAPPRRSNPGPAARTAPGRPGPSSRSPTGRRGPGGMRDAVAAARARLPAIVAAGSRQRGPGHGRAARTISDRPRDPALRDIVAAGRRLRRGPGHGRAARTPPRRLRPGPAAPPPPTARPPVPRCRGPGGQPCGGGGGGGG